MGGSVQNYNATFAHYWHFFLQFWHIFATWPEFPLIFLKRLHVLHEPHRLGQNSCTHCICRLPIVLKVSTKTTLYTVFSERELMFTFAICRRPSVCLSSVCNVRAPYSGDWNFRQCFYAIWYLGHLWPFGKNFTKIVPGEPLRRGVKPKSTRKM